LFPFKGEGYRPIRLSNLVSCMQAICGSMVQKLIFCQEFEDLYSMQM